MPQKKPHWRMTKRPEMSMETKLFSIFRRTGRRGYFCILDQMESALMVMT